MEVKKDIVIRLGLIYLIAVVIAIFIVGQIFYLQFSGNEELRKLATEVQYKTLKTTPERGNICAYDGKVLATSLPFYEIRMDLASGALKSDSFNRYIRPLSDSLANFFKDKSSEEYYKDISKARRDSDGYYLIKQEVSYQQYQRLKTFPIFKYGKFKGGFIAIQMSKRILPYKGLASRTIGSLQNNRYIGIEGYFHNELTGEEREKLFKKIGPNWIPVDEDYYLQTSSGMDVITTLDINYQDFAHNALLEQMAELDADTGTAVLMEVKTGEIKAMVNLTKIAPGRFIEGSNLAVGMTFEPGSTFKLMSFMTAFEDDYIDLKDSVNTGSGTITIHGFTIREAGNYGYGTLTVKQVFEKSSNVGTAMLIYKNYKNQPERFLNRLSSMEIDKKTNIEIHGEPSPKIKNTNFDWSGITLPLMSYGYEIELTPLQILNFYNAVANNGVMVKPRLIKAIRDQGKIVKEYHTIITNPSICKKATLERVKIMLEGVVKHGTADNINGAPYLIAGKTGTAQVARGSTGYKANANQARSYFGTFVGYFPADNPVYSCIVVIKTKNEHKFYGNIVAAPVFRKIADKVYASSPNLRNDANGVAKNDIPQSKDGSIKDLDLIYKELRIPVKGHDKIQSPWALTIESNTYVEYQNRTVRKNKVPLVIGMGLKDAIFLLESAGLRVIVKGKGKIVEQSIEAGNAVEKNQTITITLV